MLHLLTRLRRRPAPAAEPEQPPAPPTAEQMLADAEAAEAARLAVEERTRLRKAELAAELAAAEAAAKVAAVEHKAEVERRRRENKLADDHARAVETARQADLDAERAKRAEQTRTRRVKIATAGERGRRLTVNIIINIGAGYGQAAYAAKHLAVPVPVAVMLAAGLELMAVTVLDYGLTARKQGRPFKLKMVTAALMAGVVATLNYSHWAETPRQQGLAVPMFLLSLLCPLLWAWYHAAREVETAPAHDLAAPASRSCAGASRGSTDIAEFDALQWLLFPVSTLDAKRHAIRYRIADPEAAYRAAAQHAADKEAAERSKITHKAQAIKEFETRAAEATARVEIAERTAAELHERLGATQVALDAAQRRELDAGPDASVVLRRYLPTKAEVVDMGDNHQEKRESAEDAFRQALLDGVEIPGGLLGTHYGMSPSWGRACARRARGVIPGQIADDETDDDETDSATSAE